MLELQDMFIVRFVIAANVHIVRTIEVIAKYSYTKKTTLGNIDSYGYGLVQTAK